MYKKRTWHYFLFDLCYYTNVLDLVFIWAMPTSPALFVACYCISMGSLASAVITWRNSLVFHDWDKVTSLFVHIYPPLVFSVIRCVSRFLAYSSSDDEAENRHYYPDGQTRFPALREVPHLQPFRALLLSGIICKRFLIMCERIIDTSPRSHLAAPLLEGEVDPPSRFQALTCEAF